MQLLLISGILGLAFASFSSATQVRRSYVAASVMHFPHNSSSTPPPPQDRLASTAWARSVIQTNLQAYTEYVRTASVMHRADIIVFPESGTGYLMFDDSNIPPFCENIPVPGWTMNCSNIETSSDSPHAEWASCAAQRFNIDIVVNYCGIDPVTSQRFNLNAAFLSGSGLAIASYRKSHINAVPVLTQPSVPDPVVFVSSFGVEFGLFVCYDLWFRNPVHDDLTKLKARHFAYPNGMASLTPLFTIDQVHAGFSLKHNVTLVSAGLFSTGGAGVFHRGDALVINPQWPWAAAGRSVVTARVPLTNEAQSVNPPTSSVLSPVTSITGVSCFTSTASCAVFAPGVNASFALKSSFIGRHGRVDCEANVTTLTGNSTHVWMLAASQLTMVPAAPNTPNASLGAYCMLLHCDTPDQGCNFGDPSSLSSWESDLELTSAAVRATFSSGFYAPSANGTVAYPVYGQLAEGVNQTSQIAPWPLTFLRRGELHYREDLTTNTYQLQTTDAKSTGSGYLLSFGIYAAAAGPQW